MSNQVDKKPLIEKAKSGRSTCRICHNKIVKDSFRIGFPTSFTLPDGNTVISYRYFHPECTSSSEFKIHMPLILEVLENMINITNSEKEILLNSLLYSKQQFKEDPQDLNSNQPFLEYSKSGRGKCRLCDNPIPKDIFRVVKPSLIELTDGKKIFGSKLFHLECFTTKNSKLEIDRLIESSIKKGKITEEDSISLIKEVQKYFSLDKEIEDILALIKEEPIKLNELRATADTKGINFTIVKKAIEKGLVQGIYFQPTSDTIQKL